eukprot:3333712-Alexandrium_andersonii.AAC.1
MTSDHGEGAKIDGRGWRSLCRPRVQCSEIVAVAAGAVCVRVADSHAAVMERAALRSDVVATGRMGGSGACGCG